MTAGWLLANTELYSSHTNNVTGRNRLSSDLFYSADQKISFTFLIGLHSLAVVKLNFKIVCLKFFFLGIFNLYPFLYVCHSMCILLDFKDLLGKKINSNL